MDPMQKQPRRDIEDQDGIQSFDDHGLECVSSQPSARLTTDQSDQRQRPARDSAGQEGSAVPFHDLACKSQEGIGQNEKAACGGDVARGPHFIV